MRLTYKEHSLNRATIDTISSDVQDYLKTINTNSRGVQRIRLTIEELLLNIMERCGEGKTIRVGLGKQFGRHIFRICYESEQFDPSMDDSPLASYIMQSLGLSPTYSHRRNTSSFSIVLAERPKVSTLVWIIIALLSALLVGFLGRSYIAEAIRQNIIDIALTPMASAFLGLLNTFSGLMICVTICSGIIGMGDSETFGRVGRSLLTKLVLYSFAVCTFATALILPFVTLSLTSVSDGAPSQINQISQLLFGILPSDIVTPFMTGNILQVIVIAVIIGIVLISVGERGSKVRGLVNESSTIMQKVVSTVCLLVPIYIFVILVRQIWVGQEKEILLFLKPLLLSISLTLTLTLIVWMISSLRLKCPPLKLLKKILPPFLVALTTASSFSALPLAMDTGEKKLGINQSTISFVMPITSVIYMPSSIVHLSVLSITFAEIYQVEITLSFILMTLLIVPLCAIALPPIPGAGTVIFTILFSSFGIPVEAIVMAIALDIVFDFFDTGFNVMMLMMRSACEAKKHNALDQNILLAN